MNMKNTSAAFHESTYTTARTRLTFFENLENASGENGYEALRGGLSYGESPAILDAGAGEGRLLPYLNAVCPTRDYTGLDVSANAIAQANQKYGATPRTRFLQGDVCQMPFNAHSFDMVFGHMVFALIPDVEEAFSEVSRVLKPGGVFRLFTPAYWRLNDSTESRRFQEVMDFLSTLAPHPSAVGIGNKIFRTREGIETALRNAFGGNCDIGFASSDFEIRQRPYQALQIFSTGMYQFLMMPDNEKGPVLHKLHDKILSLADEHGVVSLRRPMEVITLQKKETF